MSKVSVTRLKVGLLGAGYIVQAHASALAALDDVEMQRCATCRRSARARSRRPSASVMSHARVDELIASDCDVVHVLLPPFLHEDVTRRLLEAGKSVFVEKPMGLSAAECRALAELAEARGLRLGVNHNFLFLPGYEALRRDAANGTLGTLDHLTVNWLYALGLIQFGPYNNWILGSEGNLLFELGLAPGRVRHRSARPARRGRGDRVRTRSSFPGDQRVFRHWNAIGRQRQHARSA